MTPEAAARLPSSAGALQVNRCKNPACVRFGALPVPSADASPPARHGIGPGAYYDGRYAIGAAGRTQTPPVLECLSCGEAPPLKSNAAIAAEIGRLDGTAGAVKDGCPNPSCGQCGASPAVHPQGYVRCGKTSAGTQRLKCKACGRRFTPDARVSGPPRQALLYEEYQALRLCVEHIPFRKILGSTGLNAGRFYPLLHRAADAARVFQRRGDARAASRAPGGNGRIRLAADRQVYSVNWSDRGDRRKVMVHGIATADLDTDYVFAMDANYDPGIDAESLAREAQANGDAERPPCERRSEAARVWLPWERNLRMEGAADVGATTGADALRRYRRAAARADVEMPEAAGRAPTRGALVREDIAVYAHFLRVRRMLGDSIRRATLYFEQESAMRAACMEAWGEDIRAGRCEAYYVRIAKDRTAKEKREIGAASRKRVEAVMASEGCSALEARRRLVRDALARAETRGPWRDRWLRHPCPSAFEPSKEVCRLTRRDPQENEAERPAVADGYAFAGLGAADRFFLKVRYALNALDRARVSGKGHGRRSRDGEDGAPKEDKWDVYHPYNPAHVQELLDLLRLDHNWCAPGEDGRTPAMRLGVAERPLELGQVLEAGGEDLREVREIAARLASGRQARRARPDAARQREKPVSSGMTMT